MVGVEFEDLVTLLELLELRLERIKFEDRTSTTNHSKEIKELIILKHKLRCSKTIEELIQSNSV